MNQLFSGQTRTRPSINLSGAGHQHLPEHSASSSSSSSLSASERARQERAAREAHRRLETSARRIQAFWRAQHTAGKVREDIRHDIDKLLVEVGDKASTDKSSLSDATQRLAFVFRPGNAKDLTRLSSWARLVATGKPKVRLFQPFSTTNTQDLARWKNALSVLSLRMIQLAAASPR